VQTSNVHNLRMLLKKINVELLEAVDSKIETLKSWRAPDRISLQASSTEILGRLR